ncbi:MAG: caspase family protein [Nitrospirae bacterium]|nr:caspase family protein [Nitrospirota bacterium]
MKKVTIFILFIIMIVIAPLSYALDNRAISIKALQSEKRVALVIGNGKYKDSPLNNPVNDALAMAKVLEGLNFKVLSGTNLTQKEMKQLVISFGKEIKDGGVGLFYFAGHGVQVNGQNYLIPVSAVIESEEDVDVEALNVDSVLAKMASANNRLNIVILDACRNNPFARSFRSAASGLAQMKAPKGTFIAYATAPGSVASDGDGQNGLYTQELMRNMKKSGLKIEEMFKDVRSSVQTKSNEKQTPWESSSLTGDFYFKLDTNTLVSSSSEPAPQKASKSFDPEGEMWETIKDSNDASDFKTFIKEFPNSKLTATARLKIKQLEKTRQKTAPTETALMQGPPQGNYMQGPPMQGQPQGNYMQGPPKMTANNSKSSGSKYKDNGDGTVTDTKTGLMWTQKDSYADLGKCMSWDASKSYISGLKTGGHSDWRMPTVDELKGIFEESKSNTTFNGGPVHLDTTFASGGSYWYWSSEEANFCCAKFVLFYDGTVNAPPKSYCDLGGVRAVRSGN